MAGKLMAFKKAHSNQVAIDKLDVETGKPFLGFCKRNIAFILAFFIPVAIMIGTFIVKGDYPFGDKYYLVFDMYHQYVPFLAELQQKLINGGSLLYSWHIGMGSNFAAIYAYYLSSPVNWLIALVPHDHIITVIDFIIIFKIGLSGLTFAYYLYRHFRTKHFLIVNFAVFYSLSSYLAAYSWNIMWLDCLIMLPLILLGLECLVKENKCFLYCAALGFSIFSNYYLSIMICIFCVLYFIVLLICESGIKEEHFYRKRILGFAVFSALAGGFAACLIMPELFALKLAASGSITFPQIIKTYYSFFDLIYRSMMVAMPEILKGQHPNIYCTVAVFFLIPLYWCNKSISLKEKICQSALLGLMLISFNLNILDFIWHGFHFPNNLPCRQSFIYIFLILTMSFAGLRGLREYKASQIYVTFAGVAALLLIYTAFIAKIDQAFKISIILTMLVIAAYLILIILLRRNNSPSKRKIFTWLAIAVIILEASVNTGVTAVGALNIDEYFSDNAAIAELLTNVNKNDTGFYRVEKDKKITYNDGAWNQYQGVTEFSSTENAGLTNLLGALGFEHSVNNHSFSGYTPLTESLLSVKYVLYDDYYYPGNGLTSLYDETDGQYLYQNNYSLPLGLMVDSNLAKSWDTDNDNPFIVQNNFAKAVTGLSGLFEPVKQTKVNDWTVLHISDNKPVYIYILSDGEINSVKATITVPGNSKPIIKTFSELQRTYILNLGSFSPGSEVAIFVNTDEKSKTPIYAYSFDDQTYKEVIGKLAEQPFTVATYNDTYIKGSITAASAGLMFTSIPYDDGWVAYVDGKKTQTEAFKNAFICLPLSAGTHTVEFYYYPQGLKAGIIISVCCLLVFALLVINKRKFSRRYESKNNDT